MKPADEKKLRKGHVADLSKMDKTLEAVADQVNTIFKDDGLVVRLEDPDTLDTVAEGFSTGYQPIDDILTGGTDKEGHTLEGSGIGFPKGRIIEVFGPESSGKTSLSLMAIADCQRSGGVAAFIDLEHSLDLKYAKSLGVDVTKLLYSQPDHAQQAMEVTKMFVQSKKVDLISFDSVAAMVPKEELEGDIGSTRMGLHARIMSSGLKKLVNMLKAGGPTIIFINQTRQKIGVLWGDPTTTPGGNALKFYASIRCDLRIVKRIKDAKRHIGVCIRARTIKNKVAPPMRDIYYNIIFNKGVEMPSKEQLKALLKRDDE